MCRLESDQNSSRCAIPRGPWGALARVRGDRPTEMQLDSNPCAHPLHSCLSTRRLALCGTTGRTDPLTTVKLTPWPALIINQGVRPVGAVGNAQRFPSPRGSRPFGFHRASASTGPL